MRHYTHCTAEQDAALYATASGVLVNLIASSLVAVALCAFCWAVVTWPAGTLAVLFGGVAVLCSVAMQVAYEYAEDAFVIVLFVLNVAACILMAVALTVACEGPCLAMVL